MTHMINLETNLESWDEKILEKAAEFGLSCFPQEFEICDHNQMLGAMAYSGMPSHYPHWSYGKAYEKLKTLYDHGVSGLPYEMVINSNPALAYLMRDNTLALNILTIAHVCGHNDFFRNNFTFQSTKPELTISSFKARANRMRSYIEDPSIGLEKVENLLDAAHALSLQCRRNLAIKKLSRKEEEKRLLEAATPPPDPFYKIHAPREYVVPDLRKVPLLPEEDILLFIRDHNPLLEEWERDILTIVHESAQYFVPQIDTKIMNEGWASFWHYEILRSIDLPQDLYLEFLVRHNQVVRPIPRGLNPYHIGLSLWNRIALLHGKDPFTSAEETFLKRMQGMQIENPQERIFPPDRSNWRKALFEVRAVDRDVSFLRRFLTEEAARDLDLFEFAKRGDDIIITRVSNKEEWEKVKATFLANVGMGSVPAIKVEDADHDHNRNLYVKHYHDGRDLQLGYAEKTLEYLHRLWGQKVLLETVVNEKKMLLCHDANGFSTRAIR